MVDQFGETGSKKSLKVLVLSVLMVVCDTFGRLVVLDDSPIEIDTRQNMDKNHGKKWRMWESS